ncbi:MAG: thiamine-phosphate kinase [Zoogloeaceae bacterium]|nr:thiamine-phosphate kinase [Zoogloeaceae bacterium]
MRAEFALIRRYFSRAVPRDSGVFLGTGDDAALLSPSPGMFLAASCDTLHVGVHFLPETNPRDLGWKTLAVNLSDLAAMGAAPRWAMLAISLPRADAEWLSAFSEGFYACAETFSVTLVGGDVTEGALSFTVTALGEAPPESVLRRGGAQAEDDLWVSGTPGRAALGLDFLRGRLALPEVWQPPCVQALQRPVPRVALGLALREKARRGLVHAAIDVSDGLMADIGHLAAASGVVAHIETPLLPPLPEGVAEEIARAAQYSGGDDYELVFAAAPRARDELFCLAQELNLPLTRIGTMRAKSPHTPALDPLETENAVNLIGANGETIFWPRAGYAHFEKAE